MVDFAVYLAIAVAGFVPTYIWRGSAVLLVKRMTTDSPVLLWVRSVATALVAAIVTKLVLVPPGLLGETSLTARLLALAVSVTCFYAVPRHKATFAVLAGSAVIFISELIF